MEGKIHQSWIYKPLSAKDVLTDLWNIAETGIDVAEAIFDAHQFFQGTAEQALTQAAVETLEQALDNLGDEESPNPKIAVSWSNIKNRPIASSTNNIGIRGDLIVADAKSLKSIPANQFSTNSYGQLGMSTSGADTIINFGTKEAFFNSNTTRQITTSNITASNISSGTATLTSLTTLNISTSNFTSETGAFKQEMNVGSNQITLSNNQIYFKSGTDCNMIVGSNFIWNRNTAFTVRTSNLLSNFYPLLTVQTDGFVGVNSSNPQYNLDVNGVVYCRSNLLMDSPATIRANEMASNSGVLTIEPEAFRFIRRTSNIDTINWSVNSNGMFLLQRNAIFGKTESASSNFTRLEQSLENGLIWGRGLSNNFGTDADLFQFKTNGELYTADYTGTMKRHINSNAEIHKGTMVIDNDGNLKVNESNVILSSGTIQRRPDPNNNIGFQVTPSGYVTIGDTSFNNDGFMTACNATISNLSACNINAVTITSCNVSAPSVNIGTTTYTSNAITMANKATDTFTIGASNVRIDGNMVSFSNHIWFACSNNGLPNARFALIRNHNFSTPSASFTGLGIAMVNDGFGTGHTYLYNNGSSNGSNTGPQPIWISGAKFGVGKSNPAYECDVNGTANATTIREGTTLLSEKYALSNTLSNYALSNAYTTFSNYITVKSEWASNNSSNLPTLMAYNGFSNYLTPMSIWASNNSSNVSTNTSFTSFSNWISPRAIPTGNGVTIQGNFGQFQSHSAYSIAPVA